MRALVILALAFVGTGWAWANGPAGADPFSFLFLDANARAVAMGGAYSAIATDANALLYNPAGLGRVGHHEITFMHNQYFQGINQEYIGFASRQGWGLNLNYLNFGQVTQTTISNPDGTGLGVARLADYSVGAGYGFALNDYVSVGAGIKFLQESITGMTASGYGLDLGVLGAVPNLEHLHAGAALQNMGPSVKFQGDRENMPFNTRLGLAYDFDVLEQHQLVSLEVGKERTQAALWSLGIESRLVEALPIRFGFTTKNNAGIGISVGFGWAVDSLSLDYAFVPFGDLGDAHRISATWRWGTTPSWKKIN